jgi:hemerythrin
MEKRKVANGVFWVEIPESDLRILCGCPADAVKLLMKKGLITPATKGGVISETGPNGILLSDTPIQKGSFANLSEFPFLQMLYRQGMILPGHPNNTGQKPLLIGIEDQVRAQSGYIFRAF